MTKREAAIVSAYTGMMLGKFSDMHQYVEEKMGRPVQTIEFSFNHEAIKEAAKVDFIALEIED